MSYFEKTSIQAADSPSIDAFARLRISDAVGLFDSKQLYDTGSLYWATGITGNATASFNILAAAVTMSAVGNPSRVIRQSKRHFNYQAGKSHLIICTSNLNGHADNVVKKVGYFDDNNGLYFQTSGSSFGTVIRKNGLDTFTSQSAWNIDTFNGSGSSGKSIDISKSQIYFMDFEWLGVGRVRYGIFQAGIPTYVHQLTHVNALTDVYMSSPNLPIRYELVNSGSTPQAMLHICSAVISEGGYESTGQIRSVDFGPLNSPATAGTANTYFGIVALRLKPTISDGSATIQKLSALNTAGNNHWGYTLLLNPATGSNFVWQDVPDSVCQYATGSVALTANTGTKIVSGYVSSTADAQDTIPPRLTLSLGRDINNVSDVFVLAVNTTTNNQTFVGSLTFQENT